MEVPRDTGDRRAAQPPLMLASEVGLSEFQSRYDRTAKAAVLARGDAPLDAVTGDASLPTPSADNAGVTAGYAADSSESIPVFEAAAEAENEDPQVSRDSIPTSAGTDNRRFLATSTAQAAFVPPALRMARYAVLEGAVSAPSQTEAKRFILAGKRSASDNLLTQVCMHVCVVTASTVGGGWMDGWIDGWMDGWMDR